MKTRVFKNIDHAQLLASFEGGRPASGLVDLRYGVPLEQTRVLHEHEQRALREAYEALREQRPAVIEPQVPEITERTLHTLGLRPRRRFMWIGVLAIATALGGWSLSRALIAPRPFVRAAAQKQVATTPAVVAAPVAASQARPREPASPVLARAAVEALARGEREAALRAYETLARHESLPGVYHAAAAILARELRTAE